MKFTATETGRFPYLCSEYCGDGHDGMKGMLVVVARDAAPQAQASSDSPARQSESAGLTLSEPEPMINQASVSIR